jgi:hypothetical protein
MGSPARWIVLTPVALVLAILLVPSGALGAPSDRAVLAPVPSGGPVSWGTWVPIDYREPGMGLGVDRGSPVPPGTVLDLTLTLPFSHSEQLATLLDGLSQPGSPAYREYLSASEFDGEFGGSSESYDAWVEYASSQGAAEVQTYGDRATLTFQATPAEAGVMFHTSIEQYHDTLGQSFYAPATPPEVPQPLAVPGVYVDGLSSYSRYLITAEGSGHPVGGHPVGAVARTDAVRGYLAPVTLNGVQYQFASEYQIAYDQASLYQQYGYPTDMVAATILWSGNYTGPTVTTPYGTLTDNEAVGPFDPNDIYTFYNETIPTSEPWSSSPEPHSTVIGAPIDGAPEPGPLASWDQTNAVFENTLDLEDLGSMAPGSTIYNVYGSYPSNAELDQAFAYILSPNASTPGLANVSVISNSWGTPELNDTGWYQDLEEAQARGITVLAISGDSGDSSSSAWGIGNTWFPGSMAYDTFGDVAVGGTTNTLSSSTLSLLSQKVWYISDPSQGGPVGSSGGISPMFAEPAWQSNSSANSLIAGAGRGVPDIAAVANNSLMTYTYEGFQYRATNASVNSNYYFAWGTSIATPVEAGIVVEIDHVLEHGGNGWLGFLDPTLYPLASEEDAPLTDNGTIGFYAGPSYQSILPTLPLTDVEHGANALYAARAGYDLATGWGAIDAYNLTMYYLSLPPNPTPGRWTGVQAALNLSGLVVDSSYPGYGYAFYNASTQQNFFVANSLGAPMYWVQNVVYITGVPGDWQMNFTGWLVYPFYGLEGSLTLYEYDFPVQGLTEVPPVNFTFQTQIVPGAGFDDQQIEFSFGTPGASSLYLPAPGASFIIGNLSYNYSWDGVEYSNGPIPEPYGGPGGLDPQFGLVGGPGGYIGNYLPGTHASVQLEFSLGGPYLPGQTAAFDSSIDQTGESASNLTWTETNAGDPGLGEPATWAASYRNGASLQGVLESEPSVLPPAYNLTVSEQGLPDGSHWGIDIAGAGAFNGVAPAAIEAALLNGSYSYTADPPAGYAAVNGTGLVQVNGSPPAGILLTFVAIRYNVTVDESGLPDGTPWGFNTSARTFTAVAPASIVAALPDGSVTYNVTAGAGWTATPRNGTLTIAGTAIRLSVVFSAVPRYQVTFEESGLPSTDSWWVDADGLSVETAADLPVAIDLVDGTFPWTVSTTDPDWEGSPSNGSVTVAGSSQIVAVSFVAVEFPVTFEAAGLLAGDLWTVTAGGITSPNENSTQGFTLSLANGTYTYAPSSADPAYRATGGTLTVDGSPVTVRIPYAQVMFLVTLELSGLPSASTWSVTFNGSTGGALPASATASYLVPNGTYPYSIGVPSGYTASPGEGTVHVEGAAQQIVVAVHSTPAGSELLGLPGWAWAAGGVVVVAIGAVVLIRVGPPRRDRSGDPKPASPADGTRAPPSGPGGH